MTRPRQSKTAASIEFSTEFRGGLSFDASRATDPRDKLFALYGLANDIGPNRPLLKADYLHNDAPGGAGLSHGLFISRQEAFAALAFAGLRVGRMEGRRGRPKLAANDTMLKLFPGVKA